MAGGGLLLAIVLAGALFTTTTAVQAVPQICQQNKGKNILRCQKTCAVACDDAEFYASHMDQCDRLLEIPARKRADDSGCSGPPADLNPYERCVLEAESMRPFSAEIAAEINQLKAVIAGLRHGTPPPGLRERWKRISQRKRARKIQAFIKKYEQTIRAKSEFNKGFESWDCGRLGSPTALRKFYACIADESSRLSEELETIIAKTKHGVCGSEEAQEASNKLLDIKLDIDDLGADVDAANRCLTSITKWQEKRAKRCKSNATCSASMHNEIEKFKAEIATLDKTRKHLSARRDSVKKRIDDLEFLIISSQRCD